MMVTSSAICRPCRGGQIERDCAQETVLAMLAGLDKRLREHRLRASLRRSAGVRGACAQERTRQRGLHFRRRRTRQDHADGHVLAASPVVRKRRVHFHEFMADVHERARVFREKIKTARSTMRIRYGSRQLRWRGAWLLCFDEFHVTRHRGRHDLGRPCSPGCSSLASSWSQPPTLRRMIYNKTASTARCSCRSSICSKCK